VENTLIPVSVRTDVINAVKVLRAQAKRTDSHDATASCGCTDWRYPCSDRTLTLDGVTLCILFPRCPSSATKEREHWARLCIKAKRVDEQVHDAPDGKHKEETNDAPGDERATFLALLLVACPCDEVAEYSPKEHHKGHRKDDRHDYHIDNLDDVDEEE